MKRIFLIFSISIFISIPGYLYSKDSKTAQVPEKAAAIGSPEILEELTIKVASEVGKSVVSITSIVKAERGGRFYFGSPFGDFEDDLFKRFFEDFFGNLPEDYGRMALGSGTIIDKKGYILTNAHVVNDAKEIKVTLSDGREFNAVIKGKDTRSDLAVIKIDDDNLTAAKLGDSDNLKIGQWAVALGNPFGISTEYANPEPTVTFGVISALHRYLPGSRGHVGFDDLIQTDAAINPGNSGGPLVNMKGEIVGINMAIITRSGGYEGVGFAIPINKAKRILNTLIKGEKVLYGWLGVSIQDLNADLKTYFGIKEKEGVIAVKVFKDSPADKANIKEGDLILAFNSRPVKNSRELVNLVTVAEVGKVVPVMVLRDGKEINLKIKIGSRPEDIEKIETIEITGFRGMEVEDITPYLRKRFRIRDEEGVVVVNIEGDSPADRAAINVGDLIIKVGDKRVRNREDFEKAILGVRGNCLIKTNRGYYVLKEK